MSISKLTSGVHDCFSQICKFQIFLPSENLSECLRSWLCLLSCVWLFVTPWMVACQALLSMGFSRQEYWSGLTFPPPGDLPDPGMEPTFLESPAFADGLFTLEPSEKSRNDDKTKWFPCIWETQVSQLAADLFRASALVIAGPPWPLFPEPLCLPLHVLNSRLL